MIRILLLAPKGSGPGNQKKWNRDWPDEMENKIDERLWKVYTPGVLVLASLCHPDIYIVDIVDEAFQEVNLEITYDIVAMYTITPNANRAYRWAEYYKACGSHVVLGGVHVQVCPEEAKEHCDTILQGEAEIIWPLFLKDYENHNPKKIYKQETGEVDVNLSPVPAFEKLPQNARKIIPIQTARGCPHGCSFCNLRSLYGSNYRSKSISRVVEEVEKAKSNNPYSIIYFTDDNLFCSTERSKELVRAIHPLGIYWYTHCDISFGMNEILVKEAFQAGCRQVLIGLESVHPTNLNKIDELNFKERHVKNYKEIIETIQSNGIGVIGSFIIGLESDNHRIFDDIYKFVEETNLYGVSITVNTPYPGTKMYDYMHKNNLIISYDWNDYTIFQPVIKTMQLTAEEISKGYLELLKKVYGRDYNYKRTAYFKEKIKNLHLK